MLYVVRNIVWKILGILKRTNGKYNWFKNIYILPLTNEELNSYQDAKYVTFVEKESQKRLLKIKIIEKSDIIVIIQVNTETQHIVLVIQNLMYLMKFL